MKIKRWILQITISSFLLYTCDAIASTDSCPNSSSDDPNVSQPPSNFSPFYQKYIDASGIAIVGSKSVCDRSLQVAYEIINEMLSMRPDIRTKLIEQNIFVAVFAVNEKMTNIPENQDLAGKWADPTKTRTFDDLCGSGGVNGRPTTICERNLIGINDPYYGRYSVLIHEFGHTIQNQGLDSEWYDQLPGVFC